MRELARAIEENTGILREILQALRDLKEPRDAVLPASNTWADFHEPAAEGCPPLRTTGHLAGAMNVGRVTVIGVYQLPMEDGRKFFLRVRANNGDEFQIRPCDLIDRVLPQ